MAPLYNTPAWRTGGQVDVAATSVAVPWPAAHRAGDIMLVAVNCLRAGTISVSANPTGWELLGTQNVDATTSATADHQTAIYLCRATSSAMPTPTFLNASSDYMLAAYGQIRGASERGTVLDAVNAWLGEQNTNGLNTFTWSSVTTTVDDCLIVNICGTGEDTIVTSGYSGANIFFDTERLEAGTALGGDGSVYVGTGTLETAGPSGTITATPFNGSRAQSRFTIAFMPQQLDAVAPVVTWVTAAGAIGVSDPVAFAADDASDGLAAVVVTATYGSDYLGGAITETVHNGTAFASTFITDSTRTGDAVNGYDFSVDRTGGWPSANVTITVVATDAAGNVTTATRAFTTDFVAVPGDVESPVITVTEPADRVVRTETIVQLDMTDDLEIVFTAVTAVYPDGTSEIIYDGSEFAERYQSSANVRTALSATHVRFRIRRDDGWKQPPTFRPAVLDAAGNLGTVAA